MALKLTQLAQGTVTTAGTPVQATAARIYAYSVVVSSDSKNTGKVYVGDSAVASTSGIELDPGQSVTITPEQIRGQTEELLLSDIYVDASVNSSKFRISYLARR